MVCRALFGAPLPQRHLSQAVLIRDYDLGVAGKSAFQLFPPEHVLDYSRRGLHRPGHDNEGLRLRLRGFHSPNSRALGLLHLVGRVAVRLRDQLRHVTLCVDHDPFQVFLRT